MEVLVPETLNLLPEEEEFYRETVPASKYATLTASIIHNVIYDVKTLQAVLFLDKCVDLEEFDLNTRAYKLVDNIFEYFGSEKYQAASPAISLTYHYMEKVRAFLISFSKTRLKFFKLLMRLLVATLIDALQLPNYDFSRLVYLRAPSNTHPDKIEDAMTTDILNLKTYYEQQFVTNFRNVLFDFVIRNDIIPSSTVIKHVIYDQLYSFANNLSPLTSLKFVIPEFYVLMKFMVKEKN